MGIIDDLREEVRQKQMDHQDDTVLQEQREHNYQIFILPKMQQLFSYFKELIDYLSILETPIEIAQYSNRYPLLGELYQQNYRLSTDKHGGIADFEKLTEIFLRYTCLGPDEDEFSHHVGHKIEADQEKDFLASHNIPFNYDRNLGHSKDGAVTFRITRKIPVLFKFSVDYNQSCIILEIQNHENFEQRTQIIKPDQIDEAYLDKLARYILRKDHDFLRMDIDDASREKIREHISIQKQTHAEELEAASIREQNELKKQEINKMKNKIKSFFEQIKKE